MGLETTLPLVRGRYPRILIVCEGEKTEPNYLNDIRQEKRLSSTQCYITPSDYGTGPEKVVEYAMDVIKKQGPWDEVYCVFDRDSHEHYEHTMQRIQDIRSSKPRKRLFNVFSGVPPVPCFELWFVLHFELLSRESERQEVFRLLKQYLPDYEKSEKKMFSILSDKIDQAFSNAEKLRERKRQTGNENPSTDVDILISRLFSL